MRIFVILLFSGAAALAVATVYARGTPWWNSVCNCVAAGETTETEAVAEQPSACLLSEPELADRVDDFRRTLQPLIREVSEMKRGWALRFDASDEVIRLLAEWIAVERTCCGFMQFTLRAEKQNGPVWLEITGEEGTKEMLRGVLDAQTADPTTTQPSSRSIPGIRELKVAAAHQKSRPTRLIWSLDSLLFSCTHWGSFFHFRRS